MSVQKYTKKQVLEICKNLGLVITQEDSLGCIAKKDSVMYRFEFITEEELLKQKAQSESVVEVSTEAMEEAQNMVETESKEDKPTEVTVTKKKPVRGGRPKGSKNKKKA